MAQHVSGASPPIISSIQLQKQPLVLPLGSGGSSVIGRETVASCWLIYLNQNKF